MYGAFRQQVLLQTCFFVNDGPFSKWLKCSPMVLKDWGSIPKTQKMVLDAALLNTQHYNALIKSKRDQSRERSSALP